MKDWLVGSGDWNLFGKSQEGMEGDRWIFDGESKLLLFQFIVMVD